MNIDLTGKSKHNCFLILELPYDKSDLTDAEVAKAIDTKRKFWGKTSHRKNAAIYEEYNNNLSNIQMIMLNTDQRRQVADQARAYVDETLGRRIQQYVGLEKISESEVSTIETDTGIPKSYLERLIPEKFHIQILEKDANKQGDKIEDPNPKPEVADTYKRRVKELNELGHHDIYDFLKEEGEMTNLRLLDNETLTKRAEAMQTALLKSGINTTTVTYQKNLCKSALTIFSDNKSRKEYDDFVVWYDTDLVIKSLKSVAEANENRLIGPAADSYLKQLIAIQNGDVERAKKILDAIGKKEGILIAASQREIKKIKVCPHCASILEENASMKNCPHCGAALFIKCNKCGTENDANAQFCVKCNTSFQQVKQLIAECKYASDCIKRADLEQANLILQKVEMLWPGLEEAKRVRNEYDNMNRILRKPLDNLRAFIRDREYYHAQRSLENLKMQYPKFHIVEEASIEQALEDAGNLYTMVKKAEREHRDADVIKYCEQIITLCKDYPGVIEKMRLHPPAPVNRVQVTANSAERTNIVKWDASETRGNITYKVVRKENAASNSIEDGVMLGEFSGTTFVDQNVAPGIIYFYTVYVIRSEVASRGTSNDKPAINYGEIRIKSIETGEGNVQITWETLPYGARVRAWRTRGGIPAYQNSGVEIRCNSGNLLDEGLENGVTYGYLLCVEYSVGGQTTLTKGVTRTATPDAMPQPVDDLEIHFQQGDIFEAAWKAAEPGDKVELFYSEGPITFDYGDMVNLTELEKTLTKVQVVSVKKEGCKCLIPGEGLYHVVAVTIKHDTGVIGEKSFASKTKLLQVRETKIVGTNLYILTDWPKNARAVLLLYRADDYPNSVDDKMARSVYIKERVFQKNGALIIKDVEPISYYISMFAEIEMGGDIGYSQPTFVEFHNVPKQNIRYKIRLGGGIWRKTEMNITFYSERGTAFTLPDIEIYQARGVAPIYKTQGKLLLEIPSQRVEDELTVTISLKGMPQDTGVRPFFKDDSLYNVCTLRPESGTNHMISKNSSAPTFR